MSGYRNVLEERIEKDNPCRELTAEESKRLNKLEGMADKLNRGVNVQNCHLQTWLSHELAPRLGLQDLQPALMVSN